MPLGRFCYGFSMRKFASRVLPARIKDAIKKTPVFSSVEKQTASKLARTSRRLDTCASQFAHILHLSGISSLEGKVCLEVGSGWVLTHALVCYLLGAKKIIATDITPCAMPSVLTGAVQKSVTSLPRDILAPFSDHAKIRERMERLVRQKNFSFETLGALGIEYQSPVNLAEERLKTRADFIYSLSVLEHVPKRDVPGLLGNLSEMLLPEGAMIHCLHLEDHKEFTRHPFDFLSLKKYPRRMENQRGNRMRKSAWISAFDRIENTKTRVLYAHSRIDRPLPDQVDQSISYTDKKDLGASHLGMFTKKT